MNARQQSTLFMGYVVREFVDQVSPPILLLMPNFSNYYDEIQLNNIYLFDQLELQTSNNTGFAEMKTQYKEVICVQASLLAAKVMGYASNVDDQILFNEVNYTLSELRKMRDIECKATCQIILNRALEYGNALVVFLVTEDDLTKLKVAIITFGVSMSRPVSQRNIKKDATSNIVAVMSRNIYLYGKLDKLPPILRVENPEFVKGYFLSRKVDKPASRPLAARFSVKDIYGMAIGLVVVSCVELKYKRKTTVNGGATIKNIADGVYIFILTKAGMVSQKIEVAITRGERTQVNVTLLSESM